eukprot:403375889
MESTQDNHLHISNQSNQLEQNQNSLANDKEVAEQLENDQNNSNFHYSKINLTEKSLTLDHLSKFNKEDLINLIIENKQKLIPPKSHHKIFNQRSFDFSKHKQVKIAFKFSYLGKDYKGLAIQTNTDETIEGRIFAALKRACLVQPDIPIFKSQYTRCGRTDKGVSALGNVLSLYVRKLKDDNYCQVLNHCLPADIRMISFSEVPAHFDSRFSCIYREYKYFFVQQNMNIEKMKQAARKYLGIHDFRNFCKKDESVKLEDDEDDQNFMRRIYRFDIVQQHINVQNEKLSIWHVVIRGSAFLWHQVRCMMAVLFMIGRGEEDESVIDLLYDIEKLPERPNYNIASEFGLILNECGFDDIEWSNPVFANVETYNVFRKQYEENAIDMSLNEIMLKYYEQTFLSSQQILQSQGIQIVNRELLTQNEQVSWNQMLGAITMRRKEKQDSSIIRRAAEGKNLPMSKKREKKFNDKQKQQEQHQQLQIEQ